MQLEEYFDFLAPDDIRLKGTRIGIESILTAYIHNASTPEEIAERLPAVTLEQVYATILYYHHYREAVTAYLDDYLTYVREAHEKAIQNPSPGKQRLLALKAQLAGLCGEERDAELRRLLAEEAHSKEQEMASVA